MPSLQEALDRYLQLDRSTFTVKTYGSLLKRMVAAVGPARDVSRVSVEDIEDDEKKKAEIEFMDAFAERARTEGIEAAWAPILPHLAPIIGTLVREAIPRSDPASIAAAAAIGRDRSFRSVEDKHAAA